MTVTYGSVSSFTSEGRKMISPADASVLILPPSLCVFLGGRHFNESVILLSFRHYEAVSLHPLPSFLWNFNTLQSKYFLADRKQKCFVWKRERVSSWAHLPVLLRRFQTCIFPPPLNFAGILAAAAGSSEDTAALGKQPLFQLLTYWGGALPETMRDEISQKRNHKIDLWWVLTPLYSHSVFGHVSPA